MGAEDFSYMLESRPGAYLFMGIGDAAGLHNTHYDFNDEALPHGASFFARLAERALPLDDALFRVSPPTHPATKKGI